jgi:hypothetical protein
MQREEWRKEEGSSVRQVTDERGSKGEGSRSGEGRGRSRRVRGDEEEE